MSQAVLTPASSEVIIAAPMSFAGSAQRIWKLTKRSDQTPALIGLTVAAVLLIACAWSVVLSWYFCFGILLVPYRLIRRGQRKTNRDNLRHQEMLSTMAAQHALAAQQLAEQARLAQAPLAIEAVEPGQIPLTTN
jgi:uncharacterized membrane-anchored protein